MAGEDQIQILERYPALVEMRKSRERLHLD